MMLQIYGIKNCSTVKKALCYLDDNGLAYEFQDYKKIKLEPSKIKDWLKTVPLQKLINKKGSTYRTLSDESKILLEKESTAIAVMQAHTSLIKRPLIEYSGKIVLGYDEEEYTQFLSKK